MRLRTRFVLLLVLAALVPLAMLGFVANHVSTTRLIGKVAEVQVRTAEALADHGASWVALQRRQLNRQLSAFPLEQLADAERSGFLRLVYQQNPEVHIVSLVDQRGADLSPSYFLGLAEPAARVGRDAVDEERFRAFRAALEQVRADLPPGATRLGAPYRPPGRAAPVLAMAARPTTGDFVLGVELDLAPLGPRFTAPAESPEALALVSGDGTVLLGDAGLVDGDVIAGLPADVLVDQLRYPRGMLVGDGVEEIDVLAASAPVPGTDWRVVVAEPLSSLRSPARDITARTAYVAALAMVLSVVLGVIFAAQITGPLLALRDAALSVAEGDYGRRVPGPEGNGELSELTGAFNLMSERLAQDREVIAAKNEEIEGFNRELQARVDERTRQLAEAQDRLVQSARLAAVGEMGAGLAHELNNPLAGILGLTQVVRAKLGEGSEAALLAEVEAQTRRCSEIVRRLQRYSRHDSARSTLDPGEWAVVDLQVVLDEVLDLVGSTFHDRGLELAREPGPPLWVRGDRDALAQALVQLLTSLRAAAGPGARMEIRGSRRQEAGSTGRACLTLALAGAPLRVGEDDWMASGMGLWASRQVLAAHRGRLHEPDLAGAAERPARAEWTVELPAAPAPASGESA